MVPRVGEARIPFGHFQSSLVQRVAGRMQASIAGRQKRTIPVEARISSTSSTDGTTQARVCAGREFGALSLKEAGSAKHTDIAGADSSTIRVERVDNS